jgi:hypothetical protein
MTPVRREMPLTRVLLGAWRASLGQASVWPQSVPRRLSRVYASFKSRYRP